MFRRRLEGIAAIETALARDAAIALVLCRDEAISPEARSLLQRLGERGIPVREESAREMRRMSGSDAAPELLALEGPGPSADLDALMRAEGLVFVLAGLRYPGNVGYILRCAEAAGAAGVVISSDWEGTQREEALRIGMRADRFFAVIDACASEALAAARRAGRRVVAVETGGARAPWETDLLGSVAIVVGGETTGIPGAILEQADEVVHIPMQGFIPSYNVQAAVGILLGEWLRQGAGT